MCLYTCEIDEITFSVLSPDLYSSNPLYGKYGMELIAECPTEFLETVIRTPLSLDQCSVRQGNRMTIIAALACLELDYRTNGISSSVIPEATQEKIIDTAIKLLKKDLPMRGRITQSLLIAAFTALGLAV